MPPQRRRCGVVRTWRRAPPDPCHASTVRHQTYCADIPLIAVGPARRPCLLPSAWAYPSAVGQRLDLDRADLGLHRLGPGVVTEFQPSRPLRIVLAYAQGPGHLRLQSGLLDRHGHVGKKPGPTSSTPSDPARSARPTVPNPSLWQEQLDLCTVLPPEKASPGRLH